MRGRPEEGGEREERERCEKGPGKRETRGREEERKGSGRSGRDWTERSQKKEERGWEKEKGIGMRERGLRVPIPHCWMFLEATTEAPLTAQARTPPVGHKPVFSFCTGLRGGSK